MTDDNKSSQHKLRLVQVGPKMKTQGFRRVHEGGGVCVCACACVCVCVRVSEVGVSSLSLGLIRGGLVQDKFVASGF